MNGVDDTIARLRSPLERSNSLEGHILYLTLGLA